MDNLIGHNGGPGFDFEAVDTGPSEDKLDKIKKRGRYAVDLARTIGDIEEMLAEHKREYQTLISEELPTLMVGAPEITLDDGAKIKIEDKVGGSLPSASTQPAKNKAALKWIAEEGGGADMIKMQITIDIAQGDKAGFTEVAKFAKSKGLKFNSKVSIHPQTLQAYIRDRLKNGEPTPLDILGIWTGKLAKVTLPKIVEQRASESVPAPAAPPSPAAKKKPAAKRKAPTKKKAPTKRKPAAKKTATRKKAKA